MKVFVLLWLLAVAHCHKNVDTGYHEHHRVIVDWDRLREYTDVDEPDPARCSLTETAQRSQTDTDRGDDDSGNQMEGDDRFLQESNPVVGIL